MKYESTYQGQVRLEVIAYASDVKFGVITYLRNVIVPWEF